MKNNLTPSNLTTFNQKNTSPQAFSPRIIALGLIAAILLMLGLTGCKESPAPPTGTTSAPAADLAGDYTLVSVDGKNVPCVVRHEERDITVKSGAMRIHADGTCRSESVFFVKPEQAVNRVVEADYTVSGNTLTMRWHGAGQTMGTVAGNQFTMNNEGMIFVYQK